jgi:hypothetical protein
MRAVSASEPLIALSAKWQRADRKHCAACDRELDSAIANAAGDVAWKALEAIVAADAQGPAGILIKLRAAAKFVRDEEVGGRPSDAIPKRFIFSLLADAERLWGGAS